MSVMSSKLVLSDEPQAPCVTGGMRLHTQHGLVRMQDLYDTQADIVATVDPRIRRNDLGCAAAKPATSVFMTSENAEVFLVTTKAGYQIEATAWHRFHKSGLPVSQGKSAGGVLTPLAQLSVGDRIWVLSSKGQFGPEGSENLGLFLGLFAGQGLIVTPEANVEEVILPLCGATREKAEELRVRLGSLAAPNQTEVDVVLEHDEEKNLFLLKSRVLAEVLAEHGVSMATKMYVPETVWRGTRDCVAAYLRTLIGSEGFVQLSPNHNSPAIRLVSGDECLLKDVQVLLANFGIFSRRHRRTQATLTFVEDTDGQLVEHIHDAEFELYISRTSLKTFFKEVGLYHAADVNASQDWLLRESRMHVFAPLHGGFEDEIIEIQAIGREPVFDVTQPDGSSIVINGLATGNCNRRP